jgi:transposase InsO family protein
MSAQYSIRLLCAVLEVSPSGFHAWKAGRRDRRRQRDACLREKIGACFQASRQSYGYPRVTRELRAQGERVGKARVARLMREACWQGRERRRFRPRTTHSDHDGPIAPHRLAARGAPSACDQVWHTDITYVPTDDGWLYLAVILDACSRRILGWAFSATLESGFVVAALQMAIARRGGRCPADLIVHSDRGVQYSSALFRRQLAAHALRASMSRRGNCYDNAKAEAFFSTLKMELVYRRRFRTHEQARQAIFEWIEAFYNPRRRHSCLDYLSPIDFETKLN